MELKEVIPMFFSISSKNIGIKIAIHGKIHLTRLKEIGV
jgi:hypothetical protein